MKLKNKPEEYFIESKHGFYCGKKLNIYPNFITDIKLAISFNNVWEALREIKSWHADTQKECRIYARTKA